jgi:hypothetical protein
MFLHPDVVRSGPSPLIGVWLDPRVFEIFHLRRISQRHSRSSRPGDAWTRHDGALPPMDCAAFFFFPFFGHEGKGRAGMHGTG